MTTRHIPKGVTLDTLREIIAGWDAVGAAAAPQYTSEVEDAVSVSDAVGRQTRFLEEVGVLEPHGQQRRLTDLGAELADALASDDTETAKERTREVLSDWALTEDVRGVLEGNSIAEAALVPVVADLAEQDLDDSRVDTGVSTLLDLYEWVGLLARDEDGQYQLPADGSEAGATESATDAAGAADDEAESASTAHERTTVSDTEAPAELVAEVVDAAEAAKEAAQDASDAAEEAQAAAQQADGSAAGDGRGDPHALSISLDLDADADDLEDIVRGIKEGLTEEPSQ